MQEAISDADDNVAITREFLKGQLIPVFKYMLWRIWHGCRCIGVLDFCIHKHLKSLFYLFQVSTVQHLKFCWCNWCRLLIFIANCLDPDQA